MEMVVRVIRVVMECMTYVCVCVFQKILDCTVQIHGGRYRGVGGMQGRV